MMEIKGWREKSQKEKEYFLQEIFEEIGEDFLEADLNLLIKRGFIEEQALEIIKMREMKL